jgi:hypothetical protein
MADVRMKVLRNQWVLGAIYDVGRIIPVRWLVILIGPLSISISLGRKPESQG